MPYQALARKWRPARFADVVGQRGVTQTLGNMLTSGRIAQAFVFAGPRGVGKTTTARILARALNCVQGPTAEPCGVCEECIEIGESRHIDVFEMDAATHTGIDNIREVIIEGLAMRPARGRYKVFIIDEVHQLSPQSFNALLKSVEEPPPHVVFIMATTVLDKIPDTILSRAQVFEFRTIGTQEIVKQLRVIAGAEHIAVDDASLSVIARFAEGSLRDAESAFDQVIAFSGGAIAVDDVTTTLGLVGRDLLLDMLTAVADENPPALFELAGRAVEAGHDLRQVCRELSKVVRDLLVLSIDPTRANDPDIAPENDRDRLMALAGRFSREDLMRAFDLLAKAEFDIRSAAQPRYHLEMALLRWVQLRKLVPLTDLIQDLRGGAGPLPGGSPSSVRALTASSRQSTGASINAPLSSLRGGTSAQPSSESKARAAPSQTTAVPSREVGDASPPDTPVAAKSERIGESSAPDTSAALTGGGAATLSGQGLSGPALKEALLVEIRTAKKVIYNTVVAQAQRIEIDADRVTFTFGAGQGWLRKQFEQHRTWVEALATKLAGRRIVVVSAEIGAATPATNAEPVAGQDDRKTRLRAEALADAGVQAMLDVFKAEIKDVEEM